MFSNVKTHDAESSFLLQLQFKNVLYASFAIILSVMVVENLQFLLQLCRLYLDPCANDGFRGAFRKQLV